MPEVRTFPPPSTRNALAEPDRISPEYSTFWLFFAQTSVSTRSPEATISTDESPNWPFVPPRLAPLPLIPAGFSRWKFSIRTFFARSTWRP
ncbi:hypothetical protein DSECCO2_587560 [anaerobic digester metagenome]